MLIPNNEVNILNTFSVMIIYILLLLLTNLHLKLLSTQGIGADKLLSTQIVNICSKQLYELSALCIDVLFVSTEPIHKISTCNSSQLLWHVAIS